MSKPLRCMLGLHTWLVVDYDWQSRVRDRVRNAKGFGFGTVSVQSGSKLETKVCLLCPTIKDEIAEYEEEVRTNEVEKAELDELAKRRYKQVKEIIDADR